MYVRIINGDRISKKGGKLYYERNHRYNKKDSKFK